MHREDFERQLDANPTDWELRRVYGDWLEEQGDDFCETQRWMAEHEKAPRYDGDHVEWYWYMDVFEKPDYWDIPQSLFGRAYSAVDAGPEGRVIRVRGGEDFPTRQTAEQWLHERLSLRDNPSGDSESVH